MRPFVWDKEIEAAVKAVREYAESTPITEIELQQLAAGFGICPGDQPERCLVMPFGFRLVFTIEDQPDLGRCRHVSASCPGEDRVPNPHVFELYLLPALGYRKKLRECAVWLEDLPDGGKAVNVLEPFED